MAGRPTMPPCPERARRGWQRASWRPPPPPSSSFPSRLSRRSSQPPRLRRPAARSPPPKRSRWSTRTTRGAPAPACSRSGGPPTSAAHAQTRAIQLAKQNCALEHGLLPDDEGENLYRASPLHRDFGGDAFYVVSPAHVVDAWGAESADYSPASDTCAPGRQCGHYTQIVWPSTEEVGCGMAVCPSLGQVWVCRYRPRGNVRVLRR